ncbi:dispanin subfamily A member 2b [Fundulus heteroclitus]|uniref:Dispanin subfamily A member 2b-like n=1 Tax=Fundulus heteroclitus TaxID=8078 RepID=A0A3Q2NUT8_FUNHE|nr:dispanin subfamily A member 2b [Fundulus heteroclitus]
MNPGYPTEAYPAEAVALQASGNDGFHGQPGGPRVVQHTTVNILSEPQKDHLVWSLCSFVYANVCCLGLAALVFSVKARDQKMVGDLAGARSYASTARSLNIVAMVLISLIILGYIISIIVVSVKASHYTRYGPY